MTEPITILCPAKVNLFLSVGPADSIGYHPIRSIFQAVGLFDELVCTPATETTVTCDWDGLPEKNTLTKALALLSEVVNLPKMHIHLVKRIPVQSGLGGGSSDAAGLVRLAKQLCAGQFSEAEMNAIAPAIGADVAFFLTGGRAKAEGYGELITPLPHVTGWCVICQPENVQCSTMEMYKALDETSYPWLDFPNDLANFQLYNDFERVAPCESVDLYDRLLTHGCTQACLSGSGSAIFGTCDTEEIAQRVMERMKAEGYRETYAVPLLPRPTESF